MILFIFLIYFLLYAFAFVVSPPDFPSRIRQQSLQEPRDLGLGAWLEWEEQIAVRKLLANVASDGVNAPDAVPGTVIASPSKQHPNYYFQWIRDAAITTSTLVDLYADDPSSALASTLSTILEAYSTLSNRIQHTDTPSGTFSDLSGLGEPKFNVDGTPYTGNWGRPQRDGPALRAITLMSYLHAYNASHPSEWSSEVGDDFFDSLYQPDMPANSTIKADLEYVSHYWRENGFDVWEEVNGLHFFTAMVQLRAMQEGAVLAATFGDEGAAGWYTLQAEQLVKIMPRFWDDSKGHLVATLNSERSGLDCSLLLGSIHGTVDSQPHPYAPWSDEVLVSLLALVRDQSQRFPINTTPPQQSGAQPDLLQGVGIGRYPEDGYTGYEFIPESGNPWFLCTASVSEIMYRVAAHLSNSTNLIITSRGLPFWSALVPSGVEIGKTYSSGDTVFHTALDRLKTVGDDFLAVVRKHTDAEGSLSEQFDRVTGFERGAADLTWSYGAFIQAVRARRRV